MSELWQSIAAAPIVAAVSLAVLLGLRHATDPDHLTVVATMMVSDATHGVRRAGWLGLAWGVGHGVTLFAFGLPVVLLERELPSPVHRTAEVLVGAIIVLLALRLLLRWRLGARAPAEHGRASDLASDRSPRTAFGVGLVHGIGGSAGAGVLMIAAVSERLAAMAALLALAGATALSMTIVSAGVGRLLAPGHRVSAHLERAVPVFGVLSLAVGVWYSLAALGWTRS